MIVNVGPRAAQTENNQSAPIAPYRPIQYLGSKLRTLQSILDISQELVPTGHVFDMFSGSSVVSQAYAHAGYRVTAIDTQRFSRTISMAMLGIDRRGCERVDVDVVFRAADIAASEKGIFEWNKLANIEQDLLDRSDSSGLAELYRDLPLNWSFPDFGRSAFAGRPLVTSIYSGSYFGVKQSMAIDCIRRGIESTYCAGEISAWQYRAALTSLFTAMSIAVHSAGKHFAQPLASPGRSRTTFLNRRLLADRRVSIEAEFRRATESVNNRAVVQGSHCALSQPAEHSLAASDKPDLVYLDPPYTAQQYSRFYHILETVNDYVYPHLLVNGKITKGLYPSDRYKSAFSSKTAISAFDSILSASRAAGASAVISYSTSDAASTGNTRMVSLQALTDLCVSHYGSMNVNIRDLDHSYRQFNNSAQSNINRRDPEIILSCRIR